MEVSGVYIQLKAHVPPAYRLLFKQSHLHSQMQEASWEFIMRNQPNPEMPPIQMLCPIHYAIQISTIVL